MKRLLAVLIFATPVLAQEPAKAPAQPKTRLEAFTAQSGVVIVKSFSKIAEIRGKYDTSVEVTAEELTNAATGKHEYGIKVTVRERLRGERDNVSFVDLDEIDSLLQGLDYIGTVNKASTSLANFQAEYHTRGDLEFAMFSADNGVMLTVSSGNIGQTTAFFNGGELVGIKGAIRKANETLESIRK